MGWGKTTLCAALLGELKKWRGSVLVQGSVAYVPQTAWIFNATVSLREKLGLGPIRPVNLSIRPVDL